MTKPTNLPSIEKATGRTWSAWTSELDAAGARKLSHAEIVSLVRPRLDGLTDKPGWWAQGITVAYEQHIGRRVPGQRANGLFEVSVSKTLSLPRAELFPSVVSWFGKQTAFKGRKPDKQRTSETPKRSYWRCGFDDGSRFAATVEDGSNGKSKLVLTHTDLSDPEEAAGWKAYWREVSEKLAES